MLNTTEAYVGWCYCQVADVKATAGWCVVADVIASGRWKSHRVILLQFEFWSVNQNLIPNLWQMVFANISVEGWIIDPYVQSLFYCSYLVHFLPPNNFEIVDGNTVTTDVTMVIYGRGSFRCSLNLSPKVLEDSPIYSSSQSTLSQWYL